MKVKAIDDAINERKKEPGSTIYADISNALKNFSTLELFEYCMAKYGETYLRAYAEEQIINAEISKLTNY